MQILVSDTSVIIDLERANLLEVVFRTTLKFAMPDLLFEREFGADGLPLVALGLSVLTLSPDELALAQVVHNKEIALSLPDCFALALSTREQHILLTGDMALRKSAETKKIHCHGLLWLLDQLYAMRAVAVDRLYDGLSTLAKHPRCRLPKKEVAMRLLRWNDKKEI